MPALARGDAERLLRFVGEAESLGGDEPFTGELLVELGELVQADLITYFESDDLGRMLVEVSRTGECWEVEEDYFEVFQADSPILARRRQGYFGALMNSDFLTRRQLHRSRFYDVTLRPFGTEHALAVDIPSPPSHWKTFCFERGAPAFRERDRLLLDLLQPRLAWLWHAAWVRRRLAAALLGLEQANAREPRGVILLDAVGEVEYASEPARRLLQEFAPDESLVEWLESGSRRPLVHRLGERLLVVERVGDALLLEEPPPDLGLTAREREIMAWVACGKTNAEIARNLWLAPSTVAKHLENVYAKLGVRTRTAAVARVFRGAERVPTSSSEPATGH